jgi:ABC-2 type transport system permease protein
MNNPGGTEPSPITPNPVASNPIADLSYRNYDGPLRPPTFRWWTIARQTIRAVSKNKWLWIMSGLAGAYFLIMIIFLFVVDRLVESNPNMAQFQSLLMGQLIWKEQFNHGVGFAQIPSMIIALIVGAGAIANDNRANALLVYLSKPCTRFDYAFGKWVGVFLMLLAALAIPALAFYAYGALSFRDLGFFKQDPWLLLRILATLPLCAALNTSIILAISSLFKQGRMAGAAYAGIYFLGNFFTQIMGAVWAISQRRHNTPEIVKYLYYTSIDGLQIGLSKAILGAKGTNLLGIPISGRRGMPIPPPAPPLVPCLLIVLVVALLSIAITWKRVRAVEVVG